MNLSRRRRNMFRRNEKESYVTEQDLSKGIAIAQLFVDSLAQRDSCEMEDVLKLKRGEWDGNPFTHLGEIFQNNVDKLLQSYHESIDAYNYSPDSDYETNYYRKRRYSSLPKIMSILFTTPSQSQEKCISPFKTEKNNFKQQRRISPMSPSSPSMQNKDKYSYDDDELLHSNKNDYNNIKYPNIPIYDDDDNDDYGSRRMIDSNYRNPSPFESRFSDTLKKRSCNTVRRSRSLSTERNRLSHNLRGRLGNKDPRSRSQSNDSQLSDIFKRTIAYRKSRIISSPSESRLSDCLKERSRSRKPRNGSLLSESRLSSRLKEILELENPRNRSPQSESRLMDILKERLTYRKPKCRSLHHSKFPPQNQARSRFKIFKQNGSGNKLSFNTRNRRKSEDRDIRDKPRKRSRSKVKSWKPGFFKSKKKSKFNNERKKRQQNRIHSDNDDPNSSNGPPEQLQVLKPESDPLGSTTIPAPPVYRGPVPFFPPQQYGSTMMFYPQPGMVQSGGPPPPIEGQNQPPRAPTPFYMPPRPHFEGFTPRTRPFF